MHTLSYTHTLHTHTHSHTWHTHTHTHTHKIVVRVSNMSPAKANVAYYAQGRRKKL